MSFTELISAILIMRTVIFGVIAAITVAFILVTIFSHKGGGK